LYLTFDTEEDGTKYCKRLEGLLDHGIVPDDVLERASGKAERAWTLDDAITLYLNEHNAGESDVPLLELAARRVGQARLREIDHRWAIKWVESLKREHKLTPGTIRHYVGALARCLDWIAQNRGHLMPANPMRSLPRGYSSYSPKDIAHVGSARIDVARERRLLPEEDARIRAVLSGAKLNAKQRPLSLHHASALRCLYALALESAMRLREMYTLDSNQVDFERKTIFLDSTKNGDRRQVPLTSVALKVLADYFDELGIRRKHTRNRRDDRGSAWVFPWFAGDYSETNLRKVTSLLSRQFARIFEAARCEDLRFHDLRHEATSRFYEKTNLTDLQIAKITGHKTLSMLARYANLRGSDLADKLW
jgi:integrase